MDRLSAALRQQWRTSRSFRAWTILASIGLVLNLLLTVLWQMEIISFEESPPANDLKVYLEAGERFLQRENLYVAPRADFGLYAYSPAFAMLLGVLTFLPYKLVWLLDALLHLLAYWAIYQGWYRIFHRRNLDPAAEALVRLLPIWIIFTGLLYEIAYMNIYIFMALIATLLLEAILDQQTGKAVLWTTILVLIKPQWAFALGIPLLLGQWRFLAKVIGGTLLAYLAVVVVMTLITGSYALQQYGAYFRFLQSIPRTFIWNTLSLNGHIGYNNSLLQLIIFFTDNAPYSIIFSTILKLLLSIPLIMIFWRFHQNTQQENNPSFLLEWTFALYLLAFLWLDIVTELTFGIVIFAYLVGTLQKSSYQNRVRFVFLPYALTHIWITITGILSFLAPLPDWVIDPSLFVPFILIAMLGLYGLIVWRLNHRLRTETSTGGI